MHILIGGAVLAAAILVIGYPRTGAWWLAWYRLRRALVGVLLLCLLVAWLTDQAR